MNELPHFIADVDGLQIHFVHIHSRKHSGRRPPVLLLHGWPYSFNSFHDIAKLLANLEHSSPDGSADEGFDVIIPSMPGYDFSPPPPSVMGPKAIAAVYDKLVTQLLGYKQYVAHGGDWGSYIAELLGFYHSQHCVAIHLTMSSVRQHGAAVRTGELPQGATGEELAFAADEKRRWDPESAYGRLQSSKPVKLGYAMADSPVGVAAWMVESFHAWADPSDCRRVEDVFSFDTLLDEIMLYLVTDSFHSSTWIYVGEPLEGSNTLPPGRKIEVPCGIFALPDPVFPMPPRPMMEKSRRVVRYTKASHGGHFPFYEAVDELVADLRAFLRDEALG
jgi:pimeloyl-ACP methyl ester carboxylesterase